MGTRAVPSWAKICREPTVDIIISESYSSGATTKTHATFLATDDGVNSTALHNWEDGVQKDLLHPCPRDEGNYYAQGLLQDDTSGCSPS